MEKSLKLDRLFEMQTVLDKRIEEGHQLQEEDLFDRKILALQVELGELANETRCFKFWSLKPSAEPEVILEEFVDGIHFILSLGIELGVKGTGDLQAFQSMKNDLVEQFNLLFEMVADFRINKTEIHFHRLMHEYLALGQMLGFDFEQIKQAYIDKNEVNHLRQEQGY